MFSLAEKKVRFQVFNTTASQEFAAKFAAISKSQAVVEFNLDGTIKSATLQRLSVNT